MVSKSSAHMHTSPARDKLCRFDALECALVVSANTSFNKVSVCWRFRMRASLTLVPLLFRSDPLVAGSSRLAATNNKSMPGRAASTTIHCLLSQWQRWAPRSSLVQVQQVLGPLEQPREDSFLYRSPWAPYLRECTLQHLSTPTD